MAGSGSAGDEPSASSSPPNVVEYAGMDWDASKLTAPVKSVKDKYELLPAFLKVRGLVRQHIDSFNYFINHEMNKIIKAKGNERVTCDTDPNFYLKYTAIYVGRPTLEEDYTTTEMSPQECRLRDMTYSAPISVDVEYTRDKEIVVQRGRGGVGAVPIGRLPLMLRSDRCVLRGRNEGELASLGECPLDPGGYFVVKGTEKVILIQEQLSKNRIIIDTDAASGLIASVTSSTHERKSKTHVLSKQGRVLVRHNAFVEDVNVAIVLRAMGVASDQEMVQLVGGEACLASLLASTIAHAHEELDCHLTPAAALEYLASRVKGARPPGAGGGGGWGGGATNRAESSGPGATGAGGGFQGSSGAPSGGAPRGASKDLGAAAKASGGASKTPPGASASAAAAPGSALLSARPARRSRVDEARDILAQVVLCHVPVPAYDFGPKAQYLALMVRRLLAAQLDPTLVDNRDYYGNKRLELAGGLLALLFEDLFKRMNADLRRAAEAALSKASRANAFDAIKVLRSDTLTYGLEHALSSGNWNIRRFRMERRGVTQVLSRLSFISALGMMTRVTSQFEKTRKVSGPRALQPSQWGMVCPADTPEGESCGLVKNLALLTHVTTDIDEAPVARLCASLGVVPAPLLPGLEIHPAELGKQAEGPAAPASAPAPDAPPLKLGPYPSCGGQGALVFLNGSLLGAHRRPRELVRALRALRRRGRVGEFVSVHEQADSVHVSSDGGRVCRPLIVCERGAPRVTPAHIARLRAGEWSFSSFLRAGLVEYLDVNEENDALVALREPDVGPETTHLEIEPFAVLGVVAGLIPFPHHNQSPRNTYQCAMGKQAMGALAFNQQRRMDTLLYLLNYPQKPLLTTHTIGLVGFDRLGAGQNATVAVMSYSGYDIEDAIVMNKASLDRGFGRCAVLRKFATTLRRYPNRAQDRIASPLEGGRQGARDAALDVDGIASPGEVLTQHETLINKQVPTQTRDPGTSVAAPADVQYRPSPVTWKGYPGERCVVDKALITYNDDTACSVKVLVRHPRRPELGDKFSSRHGQKGVVGAIVDAVDLPFSERGVLPDLIMNPHGFPSRMTVGKILELLGSKAGVCAGRFFYGTAFGEPAGQADRVESMTSALVEAGFAYSGKDMLCSGITGEPLPALIFMGPVYYQKLKHMVIDKMHARARGPRVVLTRQPTEGRSRDGGLRLGEMERDCLIGYGASMLLLERLMISSDQFDVHICTHCGLMGYWDARAGRAVCPGTKASDHMATMKLPYACKLLFQELQAMNIVPRLTLADA